jgi:glutathione S-transferase
MAAPSNPSEALVLYDIHTRAACAPNPWKSRLALNFKGIAYSTTWVPLPDIPKVRHALDVPPCHENSDGTGYYTLPILIDPNTNSKIGDSFDIAVYLQKTYPASGAGDLFPPQKLNFVFDRWSAFLGSLSKRKDIEYSNYSDFNTQVEAAFTAYFALTMENLPLHPATAEATKAEYVSRAGHTSWDDFKMKQEDRQKMSKSLHSMLGELGKLYSRDISGPFLLGKQVTYADFIVGGWLRLMSVSLPKNEWEEVRACHGGIYGRLHDGLEKYAEVK